MKKFKNCGWKFNTFWKIAIVMKLSVVLTFLFSFELMASVGFSQKINIDVTDASLQEVFIELKKQSGSYFMYNESLIDYPLRIDLKAVNKSLQEVLDEICSKSPFTYEIVDDFILIKSVEPENEQLQDDKDKIKITGTISDSEGIPLPGATIHIKGTTTGTTTDIDGVFELMVFEDSNDILVISSMGFINQEVKIKDRTNFNFTLEEDNLSLNEVVITGYQQIKSERATGSYSILNEKTMENQVTANIVNKMEGVLPGVLVNEDNSFEIRGVSTLYGDDQPLFVIDGVPVETDLSKINPEDIEQITVLKDAASAAIYGVRASNGVIVIKTKNGVKGDKIKVNFSSFFTVGSKYNLGDYQAASSASIIDAELEYFDKFINFNTTNSNIDNKYFPYTEVYEIYRQQREGNISESEANNSYAALGVVDHTPQFQDLFLQNSFDQNYSLSLSGAGEKTDYYFSVGYVNAKSGFKGITNDRLTLNLKNDYRMAKWLRIGVNAYATITNGTSNSVAGEYMQRKPYEMILDSDGNTIAQYKGYSMKGKEELANQGYLDWDYNVLNDFNTRDNTTAGINFRFSVYAKFFIIEGLDFTTTYYSEIDRNDLNQLYRQESYYATNLINKATVIDPEGNLINNIPLGNIAYSTETRTNAYTFRNQLDYNKTFGKHSITALAGNEIRENDINTFQDKKYGFDPQTLQYAYITDPGSYFGLVGFNGEPLRLNAVDNFYDTYTAYLGRDVSYYGNFSWLYDSRYSLTGSVRLDQSNLFGVDKKLKSNPLWSLGGLWNIQNENFFKSKKINRLTIKISYGITGNVKRGLLTEATAISGTNRLGEFYLHPVSAQNNGIGHESTANFNVAVMMRMFSRLSINVDYFSKNSYDLLGQIPIDYTLGWNRAWANYASVSTKGLELALNWTALSKDDLTWNIGMNFTYIHNNVNEVINTTDVSTYFAGRFRPSPLEGYPINSLYAYRSGGVDENGEGIIVSKVGRTYPARSVSVLTADDLMFMGSATPTFYGGITTNLQYKKFTLDLLFTYKGGHVSRMPHPLYLEGYGISTNTHKSIANRWKEPGDEDIPGILPALKPEFIYYSNQDYGMFHTDKRVFNAGFIRFKKVSLAYNFEVKKTDNPIPIQIYGEVRNIGILARNGMGIDPDFIDPYTGILRLSVPTSFVIGLRASF